MKLTIEGTTDEIKKVLQAIADSKEHHEKFKPKRKKSIKAEMATNIKSF